MKNIVRAHAEAEAASKLTWLLQREFGLPVTDARAELRRGVLVVLLQDALSPIGRLLAQSDEGAQAIRSVYHILHTANRERMHALVSRIVGFPVRGSALEADTAAAHVLLTFQWEETSDERTAA